MKGLGRGDTAAQEAKPEDIAKAVVVATKLRPNWERVDSNFASRIYYRCTLWYKSNVRITTTELELDLKQIARAALAELVRAGMNPVDDGIQVRVYANQTRLGETGAQLTTSAGSVRYNARSDSLKFVPKK